MIKLYFHGFGRSFVREQVGATNNTDECLTPQKDPRYLKQNPTKITRKIILIGPILSEDYHVFSRGAYRVDTQNSPYSFVLSNKMMKQPPQLSLIPLASTLPTQAGVTERSADIHPMHTPAFSLQCRYLLSNFVNVRQKDTGKGA